MTQGMKFLTDPQGIEAQSMAIIRQRLIKSWPENELAVVQRLIHTSGDPSLEEAIYIHPRAVEAGMEALRRGAKVICDVEMVRTGINKRLLAALGGRAECFLHAEGVEEKAKQWGLTRAMTAIRLHAHELKGAIVAIGNAPTALFEVLRLAENPENRPALIIGVPVGFVGAAESKDQLIARRELPSIAVRGTRGGSPLAAAAVNALLLMAKQRFSLEESVEPPGNRPKRSGLALMIQGTSSNVGKSVLATAFCRLFSQEGYRVSPFKAQNMTLNSFVTRDGREIGGAQAMQALAAGVEPEARMNPVLLKPTGHSGSQVVIMGIAQGNFSAMQYHGQYQRRAWPVVERALRELLAENDIVIVEGAGSPAEVNLKANDIVNMKVATTFNLPVLLVADIDRGGALASVIGTLELLEPSERRQVKGIILNKFRGDLKLLQPAIDYLEKRTGVPVVGVVPYYADLALPEEDSVVLQDYLRKGVKERSAGPQRGNSGPESGNSPERWFPLDLVVVCLPSIANFTDFEALKEEEDVKVRYVNRAEDLGSPDLIIIPGSKNVWADLDFLTGSGLDVAVKALWAAGVPVMGIGGGYAVMGERLRDPLSAGCGEAERKGLGILPIAAEISPGTSVKRAKGTAIGASGFFGKCQGSLVEGYDLGTGKITPLGEHPPLFALEDGQDGLACGHAFGTKLHGIFDNDELRAALLEWLWERRGQARPVAACRSHAARRETAFNRLAELVRQNVDMARIRSILGLGA